MGKRKKIPEELEAKIISRSRRICAFCFGLNRDSTNKSGQIAHINRDSSDNSYDNLIYLCMPHHDQYDSKTSQSKGLTKGELIIYQKELDKYIETLFPYKVKNIGGLNLIDSFPKDGDEITVDEVKNIFLKFDKPINESSICYIVNYDIQNPCVCQWNICGWVEQQENGTKLLWHIHENSLERDPYQPKDNDYFNFEIQIGRKEAAASGWLVTAEDGSMMPYKKIRVKIKKT